MAHQLPPRPHEYVPPPRRPDRSPAEQARLGRGVMALGVVVFAGGFAYFVYGSTMTAAQAVLAILPLAMIFVAVGWSICRMGEDGPGVIAGYLTAAVGVGALFASLLWGK